MATQKDVRRLAMSLPEVVEAEDHFGFSVRHGDKAKQFAWAWHERVDPKKPRVQNNEVLAIRVADQGVKEMLLRADPEKFFTEPHYNGFPAVLVRLKAIKPKELGELLTEAWCAMAPRALVRLKEEGRNG
jgi:hypothetical protein